MRAGGMGGPPLIEWKELMVSFAKSETGKNSIRFVSAVLTVVLYTIGFWFIDPIY